MEHLGHGPKKVDNNHHPGWMADSISSKSPNFYCNEGRYREGFFPIGSMYGIFTYIRHIFLVNVGKYSIHGSYGFPYCRSLPLRENRIIVTAMSPKTAIQPLLRVILKNNSLSWGRKFIDQHPNPKFPKFTLHPACILGKFFITFHFFVPPPPVFFSGTCRCQFPPLPQKRWRWPVAAVVCLPFRCPRPVRGHFSAFLWTKSVAKATDLEGLLEKKNVPKKITKSSHEKCSQVPQMAGFLYLMRLFWGGFPYISRIHIG